MINCNKSFAQARRLAIITRRLYQVLAIESSCDDSCLALLEKVPNKPPIVIDHLKRTLNSTVTGGIVPPVAVHFHQQNLASMVSEFTNKHNFNTKPPDLICCTRGPGMIGSLSSGLQLAKGLCIGWNRPLIGVHHMLGHILVSKLASRPVYPFLSLLCSGGHTMLVLSKSLIHHEIIVDTMDIAVGDSLDKCARELGIQGNVLGKELEAFVDAIPQPLKRKFDDIRTQTRDNEFKFKLTRPLRNASIPQVIEFTFASFLSSIQHHKSSYGLDEETQQFLAFKIQKFIFQHIIDRVNIAFCKHGIDGNGDRKFENVKHLIVSGGVASNQTFRKLLNQELKLASISQDPANVEFIFPDISLCTDNAIMIGVAGIEIFETLQKETDLTVLPIRKWPMNEILEVDSWKDIPEHQVQSIINL